MLSFRDAAKKKVPPNDPVDMAVLAQQMNLSRPVSLRELINDLNNSLPDFKIFDSGQLGPSTTTGWAQVGFTIDGGVAFHGAVHESGFTGHNYSFAMAIANYRDPSGNVMVFVHTGTVEGTISGLSPRRDDPWNGNGIFDSFVSDHWDSIKNSPWQASLQVNTNAGDVVKFVMDALVTAGAIAAVVGFTIAVLAGGGATTSFDKDPETGQPRLIITPNQPGPQ